MKVLVTEEERQKIADTLWWLMMSFWLVFAVGLVSLAWVMVKIA
jgi:hypothetical protein